ncbi:formyltetrahydrofolate hydrolase [Arthrobacter sp. PL16]|uniref:hypothetical protein n=1 Tax=Arthrobacter sp. PL16 TaxID=3071720 RepID=UPI002E097C36|nr:formyltetrahydrofolate hydrolase [Arthrobacter sp. PL16]
MTAFLADLGFDIVEHQQFDDHVSGNFYLRTAFTAGAPDASPTPHTAELLTEAFAPLAKDFGMEFAIEVAS